MQPCGIEHLIQINDPLMPLLDTLTREQLWRGLVMRAEEPTQFMLGLEVATIHSRREIGDEIELIRTLDFGSFKVNDRVLLLPQHRTRNSDRGRPHLARQPHDNRDRGAAAGAAVSALHIRVGRC